MRYAFVNKLEMFIISFKTDSLKQKTKMLHPFWFIICQHCYKSCSCQNSNRGQNNRVCIYFLSFISYTIRAIAVHFPTLAQAQTHTHTVPSAPPTQSQDPAPNTLPGLSNPALLNLQSLSIQTHPFPSRPIQSHPVLSRPIQSVPLQASST